MVVEPGLPCETDGLPFETNEMHVRAYTHTHYVCMYRRHGQASRRNGDKHGTGGQTALLAAGTMPYGLSDVKLFMRTYVSHGCFMLCECMSV